jgi:hypothetical protein
MTSSTKEIFMQTENHSTNPNRPQDSTSANSGRATVQRTSVPNYANGLSMRDFEELKETVLWTEDDTHYIQMSAEVLQDQTDDILDVWIEFANVLPQLELSFGEPSAEMKEGFKKWILDTAGGEYDQEWINEQQNIPLPHPHYRFIPALFYPLTATLKPFLAKVGHYSAEDVECMHQAWIKAVTLQVCLWSQSYVKKGEF